MDGYIDPSDYKLVDKNNLSLFDPDGYFCWDCLKLKVKDGILTEDWYEEIDDGIAEEIENGIGEEIEDGIAEEDFADFEEID